eukprot:869021_1
MKGLPLIEALRDFGIMDFILEQQAKHDQYRINLENEVQKRKLSEHLENRRGQFIPEPEEVAVADSKSVWADIASVIDDAEESGSLTDDEATKIMQLVHSRDNFLKDVFVATRGKTNSEQRFIKNAKRRVCFS